MKKQISGYAAFDKQSGKAITIYWGFRARYALTDDPLKVELSATEKEAERNAIWFNREHKNPKEFEIKKVVRIITIEEEN